MVSDSSYYFVSNPKYSQILCHIMSQRWMGGANLPSVRGASTSRYVALVAVLTALFTAYGYVSSVELRAITHSVDLFFLLPAFFAILISLTGKKRGGTILAAIIGLIFLGTPSAGSNFSPHITAVDGPPTAWRTSKPAGAIAKFPNVPARTRCFLDGSRRLPPERCR